VVAGRFLGEFQHSLDPKGRVILPARFRQILGERAVLTTQDDGCLAIWTPDEFDKKAEQMKERERSGQEGRRVARAFFADALEFELTGQGRVNIPAHLIEYAGLSQNVSVNGMYDHVEIWDAGRWQQTKQAGSSELATGEG
jgi:MraZ protein